MVADSHVHFACATRADGFLTYLQQAGVDRVGLVSLPDHRRIHFNPEVLYGRRLMGPNAIAFGSFDYADRYSDGAIERLDLEEQVETLFEAGCCGIKLWEGKPTFQQRIAMRLDDDEMSRALDRSGACGMPVVLHVADPRVFWERDGSRNFGWQSSGADGNGYPLPGFDDLIAQAESVLANHPQTTIIFPHILFLAGDLAALSRLLESYDNCLLDLSPGLYFYAELSRQRSMAIDFFNHYRKRILFGTDGMWFPDDLAHLPGSDLRENIVRAERLIRFLSTNECFENPFGPTREETPVIQGLDLPAETLNAVMSENFDRIAGSIDLAYPDSSRAMESRRAYVNEFASRLTELTRYYTETEGSGAIPGAESLLTAMNPAGKRSGV